MITGLRKLERLLSLFAGVLFSAAFVETWHNRTATNPPVASKVA